MVENKALFFPGKYYHVYNHAIAWENFFKESDNYLYFLDRFYHHLQPFADLKAYCLMPNHYHLLIKTKQFHDDPLEVNRIVLQAFGNFHNCYTKSINKRFSRKGRLFQSSLCRIYIPDENYLKNVIQYIWNNPVEHGFCKDPNDWLWSKTCSVAA